MATGKLTDTQIRNFKHSGSPAGDKHFDGGGLYVLVTAAGKYWRMAYRFAGKQKKLSLGVYPAVSLAQARKARDKARELLAQDPPVDPGAVKREAKAARAVAAANTFEAVAREFHANMVEGWSAVHARRWVRDMEKNLFPYIGKTPLAQITASALRDALLRVQNRGAIETAHNLRQSAGQVFRYGIQTGRCERDWAADLRDGLKPVIVKHMAAIFEPSRVGALMRDIWAYSGQPTTKAALQLSALLFQRPVNIRMMEWPWIDFDKAMLTIPAASMKRRVHGKLNGRPHFVPLASQAVAILKDLQPLTGGGQYVFPGLIPGRPISGNTVNTALLRMGYTRDEIVPHGFRSMARTIMVEHMAGIEPGAIEAQLAHGKSGPLGDAYDRAEYLAQRRTMMQRWADYLDMLREGEGVTALPVKAA
jgi:integrase